MRLNLFNQSVIVAAALGTCGLNPRFGQAIPTGGDTFKFVPPADLHNACLIQRVDLGELFKGVPQDITGLAYKAHKAVDVPMILAKLNFDDTVREPLLESDELVIPEDTDQHSRWFYLWCDLVGLRDLPRETVTLGLEGDHLIIDASKTTLYKGQVTVKVL